ncbi:uncharacterized protein LOC125195321 [Salvia hispanica]|uniref:uncharacterized protein LOC125192756 n=1 Tax=Salvia hispanica TaxID=49212 RepID=UPI002009C259|nr:uncharacterized protein LOC125192756 [Salvia hispanica]XP_047949445.1 uncharacterized protein LOC125195321 [Salvia hispanica]
MLRLVSLGVTARRFQSTAIVSYRHFSTVSGGPQLLGALESQIKAKERCVPADLPFTIQDDDKHCHIMLTRELGREKIEVTVNPVYETDDDEESEECVRINVSISKEKKGKLGLGADVCGDEILVDKISFCEPNSYVPSMRLEGVESQGELQDALNDFVKARGIEISNVGFLYKYMELKRKRWGKTPKRSVDDLKKLHKFVENW